MERSVGCANKAPKQIRQMPEIRYDQSDSKKTRPSGVFRKVAWTIIVANVPHLETVAIGVMTAT